MEVVVNTNPKVVEYNEKITHLYDNIKKLSGSLNSGNYDKVGLIVEKVFNKVQDKLASELGPKESIAFLTKLKDVCAKLKRLYEILVANINSMEAQTVAQEVPAQDTLVETESMVVEKPMVKSLTPNQETAIM